MDLNRSNKKKSNKTLQKWSIFHDLEIYSYSDTNYICVTILILVFFFQKLGMMVMDFNFDIKTNEVHKWVHEKVISTLKGGELFVEKHKLITIIYSVYMIAKLASFIYCYYLATYVKVLRAKITLTIRFLHILN
jgi:hypothetical protein